MIALPLNHLSQLDEIDKSSQDHKVFIYKHSTSCPVSSMAFSRLKRQWDESAVEGTQFYMLDLLAYRDISNAIAERYDIRHQSPQILVISNGKCEYENSHYGINFGDLKDLSNVS